MGVPAALMLYLAMGVAPGQENPTEYQDAPVAAYDSFLASTECEPGEDFAPCCAQRERLFYGLWVRPEQLLWWVDGFGTPALVTSSPQDTDRDAAGVLGQPGTTILAGDQRLAHGLRTGGRIRFGLWFDPCWTAGVEASYFGLSRETATFGHGSRGNPILGRPFYNVEPGFEGPDAELIAFPRLWHGRVAVTGETRLQGAEVLWRRACYQEECSQLDLLAGWRFLRLDDELTITDFFTVVGRGTGMAVGTTVDQLDRFDTRNLFHGGEVGFAGRTRYADWTFELLMKLALGSNLARVAIDGSTTTAVPVPGGDPAVTVRQSGLLAQATNRGVYESERFAAVPELGITANYDLSDKVRLTFGYTFLYWSQVARPGDQIDTTVNMSQVRSTGLTGTPRPEFNWVTGDLWAQGLSFGVDCRF